LVESEGKKSMPVPQEDDLMVRLERLERANRWWKAIGLSASLAVAVLLIITASGIAQRQPAAPPPQAAAPAPKQFPVETSGMATTYVNFARVTGTPEELMLDLGLNTQTTPNPAEPVKITNRLVMNYYTVKRLLGALEMALQQHEQAYGVIETDIQKRARPGKGKE
jgi:hypothetical protein